MKVLSYFTEKPKSQTGYALIELTILIILIGILSWFFVPIYQEYTESPKEKQKSVQETNDKIKQWSQN